jgi:hypothetical protein
MHQATIRYSSMLLISKLAEFENLPNLLLLIIEQLLFAKKYYLDDFRGKTGKFLGLCLNVLNAQTNTHKCVLNKYNRAYNTYETANNTYYRAYTTYKYEVFI